MFTGINSEPSDADVDEVVEIRDDCSAHIVAVHLQVE